MATPSVSVVVPTRDRRRLLSRALRTVLGQQEVELEAIIVDDASSDGTGEFVRALGDRRVTLVRHPTPRGVAAARNAGLARAAAPWVAFLDDDDMWAPKKLVTQLDAAAGDGVDWACSGAVIVDEALRVVGLARPPATVEIADLLAANIIPGGGSGPLIRTELARSVGGFDESLSVLADWDMWIRLLLEGPAVVVSRPLVAYLRHSRSMSHAGQGFAKELERIDAKHRDLHLAHGVALGRERLLRWMAGTHVRAGNRLAAVRAYARIAGRSLDLKALARIVAVGLAPALVVRFRHRRALRAVHSPWHEEAEAWLAPLRTGGHSSSKAGGRVSKPSLCATVA